MYDDTTTLHRSRFLLLACNLLSLLVHCLLDSQLAPLVLERLEFGFEEEVTFGGLCKLNSHSHSPFFMYHAPFPPSLFSRSSFLAFARTSRSRASLSVRSRRVRVWASRRSSRARSSAQLSLSTRAQVRSALLAAARSFLSLAYSSLSSSGINPYDLPWRCMSTPPAETLENLGSLRDSHQQSSMIGDLRFWASLRLV